MAERIIRLALLGFAALTALGHAHASEPPAAFVGCAACHNSQADALGPTLRGVVGRKAGSIPGYRFSGPMRRSGLVWDVPTLTRYLENPQATVPGNRMPADGVSPSDAEQIVNFLQQLR